MNLFSAVFNFDATRLFGLNYLSLRLAFLKTVVSVLVLEVLGLYGYLVRLSVITVTYKDAQGLQNTLKSLQPLLQLPFEWENVVVDSSPDINKEVIQTLGQSLANWPLRHVQTPPNGIYPAMNSGLENAQGEYLWFLNGGDRLKDVSTLSKMIQWMDAHPETGILYAGVERLRGEKSEYLWHPHPKLEQNLLGRNGVCHQGILYRSSVFKNVGKFSVEYKLGGDYEHLWRCYLQGVIAMGHPGCLAQFDVSGVGSKTYHNEFKELKAIQEKFRSQLSFRQNFLNDVLRKTHIARVLFLKSVQKLPGAELIRPFWVKWRQRL